MCHSQSIASQRLFGPPNSAEEIHLSLKVTDYASTAVVLERIGNGPHGLTHKENQ